MMEPEDSTTTTTTATTTSMGLPGAQRSEPTKTRAMLAAIFVVDGQQGATRSEPTAIKDNGLQTSMGIYTATIGCYVSSTLDEPRG